MKFPATARAYFSEEKEPFTQKEILSEEEYNRFNWEVSGEAYKRNTIVLIDIGDKMVIIEPVGSELEFEKPRCKHCMHDGENK